MKIFTIARYATVSAKLLVIYYLPFCNRGVIVLIGVTMFRQKDGSSLWSGTDKIYLKTLVRMAIGREMQPSFAHSNANNGHEMELGWQHLI